jgi:hypothetical protein
MVRMPHVNHRREQSAEKESTLSSPLPSSAKLKNVASLSFLLAQDLASQDGPIFIFHFRPAAGITDVAVNA